MQARRHMEGQHRQLHAEPVRAHAGNEPQAAGGNVQVRADPRVRHNQAQAPHDRQRGLRRPRVPAQPQRQQHLPPHGARLRVRQLRLPEGEGHRLRPRAPEGVHAAPLPRARAERLGVPDGRGGLLPEHAPRDGRGRVRPQAAARGHGHGRRRDAQPVPGRGRLQPRQPDDTDSGHQRAGPAGPPGEGPHGHQGVHQVHGRRRGHLRRARRGRARPGGVRRHCIPWASS